MPHLSVTFKNEERLSWYPMPDGRGETEFAEFNILYPCEPYTSVFETLGILNMEKWFGVSKEEYESWDTPDFAPWTPDMLPWFKSSTGLDWAIKLIDHIDSNRADFADWKGHADDLLSELSQFRRAMELGKAHGDQEWNLVTIS